MKIAIYARVSTKDKRQDTENQLGQLREFASRQGWQVVREYVDHETGSKSDRAEFQAMFEAASQRKFDLLLFWALDRLSREGGPGNSPALEPSHVLRRRLSELRGTILR